MSDVNIACPHCSQEIEYDPELDNQLVACPYCSEHFTMGLPVEEPPARPTARRPSRKLPAPRRQEVPPAEDFEDQGDDDVVPMIVTDGPARQSSAAPSATSSNQSQLTRAERRRLSTPANVMMALGMLGVVISALGAFWQFYRLVKGPTPLEKEAINSGTFTVILGFAVLLCIVNAVYFLVIVNGASKMAKGQNYKAARMAAILMCIPVCGCGLLGVPFGIWSLTVLGDPNIRRGFRETKRRGRR